MPRTAQATPTVDDGEKPPRPVRHRTRQAGQGAPVAPDNDNKPHVGAKAPTDQSPSQARRSRLPKLATAKPANPAEPTGDYPVGYCRPPQSRQFRPGHSGNRKGRPKRSLNLKTELLREFNEKISVRENGKAQKTTKLSGVVKRAMEMALNGDLRAIQFLLNLLQPIQREMEAKVEAQAPPLLSQDDFAVLAEYAGRQARPNTE